MSAPRRLAAIPAILLLLATSTSLVTAAQPPASGDPAPIARGPHVSGVVQVMAHKPPHGGGGGGGGTATCGTPAPGTSPTNYITNCHGTGRPVNETWIATGSSPLYTDAAGNPAALFAGANDYNSYNGIVQDGFYWSSDGTTWNDAGPIDVFPHATYNAAGDPQLATGGGFVYYSSLFFNYYRCNVGGVELLWRAPTSTSWSYYQIAANSQAQFQDKPALAADPAHSQVFVSWTQYASCSGNGVASPIRIAVFSTGSGKPVLQQILTAPGSIYSQGSSIQPDGSGGFWITWEEYPSATATAGSVMLAHWLGAAGWSSTVPQTIATDIDLPSPLPGFNFRDNSFPVLAMVGTTPWIAWTDAASGVGQTHVGTGAGASSLITLTGNSASDNQFFPAIVPDGTGGAYVSFSQADGPYTTVAAGNSYDQYVVDVSISSGTPNAVSTAMVSTAPSYPNQDTFFSGGKFIGDYNGMTVFGASSSTPHSQPIWTDIRGPEPASTGYSGYEMNSMTATP